MLGGGGSNLSNLYMCWGGGLTCTCVGGMVDKEGWGVGGGTEKQS